MQTSGNIGISRKVYRKKLLPHAMCLARGTDTVPAMLTPGEAVLVPRAAEAIGRGTIRALNRLYSERDDLLKDTEDTFYGGGNAPPMPTPTPSPTPGVKRYAYGDENVGWNPWQQAIIDRINSGRTDYTFGPGSPNPTYEDLNTYLGGRYEPAGGFVQEGGVALAPSEYYQFTPQERRWLGIMDIAPQGQAGQIERYFGGRPGLLNRAYSTMTNPGRAFGNWWSEHYGGQPSDYSPSQLANLGIPYYPEGSATSQALGPLLESAFSDSGRGPGGFGMMGFGQGGTGAPTRNFAGLLGGLAGNALFPGAGLLTGPLAKWFVSKIQQGNFRVPGLASAGGQATPAGPGGGDTGGYYDPEYLRSIGYEPGQGTGSLWPGGPIGGFGGGGIGGQGGSFFGQLAGVRGGPLPGSFGQFGGGGGALGSMGGLLAQHEALPALGGLNVLQAQRLGLLPNEGYSLFGVNENAGRVLPSAQ